MTAAAAVARLRALGVTAEARGDRLALRPASAVPPDLLADLRALKAEVLALLAANDAATAVPVSPTAEASDAWGMTAADRAAAMARLRSPAQRAASPEQVAAEAADRDAIAAEPPMPALGTPQRDRLDRRQREMLAGLLLGFERHGMRGASG